MSNINLINLVGRAGSDPDIKYFESGSVMCSIPMAINRMTKDSPPDWFDLKFWGKTAEVAGNYLKKGSLFGITGSIEFERWTDRQTGEPREKMVVKVSRLELLGSKKDNAGGDF